jgi:hypothetical protein
MSLSELADLCIKQCLDAAKNNCNSLVNTVSDKLRLHGDETIVGEVICGLIRALASHTRESQIFITARQLYGKVIELIVKDENCVNTYGVALSLQDVVPLAQKIGGNIDISNKRQRITSVSFRFSLDQRYERTPSL